MYHNALSSVVDKNRQPIDVLAEDTYPFPVNVLGQERKAFEMLTPFPEDPEKNLVAGRPGQNQLRVSKDAKTSFVSPTA